MHETSLLMHKYIIVRQLSILLLLSLMLFLMSDVIPKQDGSGLILHDNAHSQGFEHSWEPVLCIVALCVAHHMV